MARTAEAIINPALLVWARRTAGMGPDEAAERAGVQPARLLAWESGEARPSIAQLRSIANLYKRPLAAFFLPQPPPEADVLKAFRKQQDALDTPEVSSALTLQIRTAEEQREAALELAELASEPWQPFDLSWAPNEAAPAVAKRIRKALGYTPEDQSKWKDDGEAYRRWRAALEEHGALIFQTSKVPVDEMRGFSVYYSVAPIITVNTKDSPKARIFTLFHELAHVLRHHSNVCDPLAAKSRLGGIDEEALCNEFAGEFLVPTEKLLLVLDRSEVGKDQSLGISQSEVARLSRLFRVSGEVIVRRLLNADWISKQHYQGWRKIFATAVVKKRTTSVRVPVPTKTVANLGRPYVRTVLSAFYIDRISLRDVSTYLGVKVVHLRGIEARMAAAPQYDEAIV